MLVITTLHVFVRDHSAHHAAQWGAKRLCDLRLKVLILIILDVTYDTIVKFGVVGKGVDQQ